MLWCPTTILPLLVDNIGLRAPLQEKIDRNGHRVRKNEEHLTKPSYFCTELEKNYLNPQTKYR